MLVQASTWQMHTQSALHACIRLCQACSNGLRCAATHLLSALLLVLCPEAADGAAFALGRLVGVVLVNVGVGPTVGAAAACRQRQSSTEVSAPKLRYGQHRALYDGSI
jgi:hypothetical protein